MNTYSLPTRQDWDDICLRPQSNLERIRSTVTDIMNTVEKSGDKALKSLTEKFDQCQLDRLEVSKEEIKASENQVNEDLKRAIQLAKTNITAFHQSQIRDEGIIETMPGVKCWRKNMGIEKVGLYIPGGTAPLFSSLLMLGIPAQLAGCKEIVVTTPPDPNGRINPAILYVAKILEINRVFKVGGAQAIAAMAFGTESIPKVSKIFGPGNLFVTKAKEIAQTMGLAIDMPAGPSEVLIIADDSAIPEFVAADLLSQAEHGPDSQVILLSNSVRTIEQVQSQLNKQIEVLPRKEIAKKALKNSRFVQLSTLEECINFSNQYAPEHLILATINAAQLASHVLNAGSVFIGNYSCESVGDYASGTNHTLPTNGFAKAYSGVSVDSFLKKITFQEISSQGIQNIGNAVEILAEAEGLFAHKNAVSVRLNALKNA